ncbi:hypothetical protein V8C43DRAFT_295397 [Trichoderma afarasin]
MPASSSPWSTVRLSSKSTTMRSATSSRPFRGRGYVSSTHVSSTPYSQSHPTKESIPNALSKNQTNAALFEAAMVLVMMSDQSPDAEFNPPLSAHQGPKDRIRAWFEQERSPTEFGWQPSARTIKLADLNPAEASSDQKPE